MSNQSIPEEHDPRQTPKQTAHPPQPAEVKPPGNPEPGGPDSAGHRPVPDTETSGEDALPANRILRASGWIWLDEASHLVGICPDCSAVVRVCQAPHPRPPVASRDNRLTEAEVRHECADHILFPYLFQDIYGIRRLARRFGFPDELLPNAASD
ncbi:MAG: hypothetical protein WCP28_14175 [Actinomycetes bacterium]